MSYRLDTLHACVDFGTAYSKVVLAQPGEGGQTDYRTIRPLALGRAIGEPNPLLAPGAIFVGDNEVTFGTNALLRAQDKVDSGREPLSSFKSILNARDLQQAIELLPPREIDPGGRFRRHDLIILFMAWLTRLIHIAVEADHASPGAAQNLRMRYTLPAYQTVRGAAKRAVIAKLFNEARAVADELGDRLIAPEGVPIDVALKVAAAARETTTSANIIEGGAYEAVAAAVCHASSAGGAQHLLVFDIGAGTTDIAALRLSASGWVAGEVQEARRSLPLGGDNFDRLMLNTFVERARAVKSVEAQARLWRRAALSARAAKEQLFAEGRAAFVFEGKTVVAKAADVFKDAEFKTLMNELSDAYAESLNAVALDAERSGEKEIAVVLAGGGANLPFIQEMLRKAKPPKNKIRVRVLPIVPAWAHDPVFGGNLAPIFSQLSIAIGGAMASTELLSAMS